VSDKAFPKRGEIYWVNLDPTIGSETQKTRPCLIVSNDIGNEMSPIVMVAPITSKVHKKIYSFEVKTVVDGKEARILLNQCKAVDKSRILKKIGKADSKTMQMAVEAIKVVFSIS